MSKKSILRQSKIRMSTTKVYTYIVVGTLLLSLASYYLIFAAEIYTPGLGGIINGITYIMMDILKQNNVSINWEQFKPIVYWIIYFLSNIPIIYLTLKWYSKRFFKLSTLQLVLGLLMTLFLSLVPGFSDWTLMQGINGDVKKIVILFLSLIAGLIFGIGTGMIYRVGACTMGLDPIARYFSRERGKNIAPILFWVAIISSSFFIFVRYFTNPDLIDGFYKSGFIFKNFIHGTVLNPAFIGSWLFVGLYSFTAGTMYSSDKKVQVMVNSKKVDQISEYFNDENYHRGHTMFLTEGGYSKSKTYNMQMIINNEEMYDVISKIASIDDEAFISIIELSKVYDIRTWNPITDEDKQKIREKEKREKNKSDRLDKEREIKQKKKEKK